MGEPAGLTPKDRYEANQLAKDIYDAVLNDEAMPIEIYPPHIDSDEDGNQAKLLRLAQQVLDLRTALVDAITMANSMRAKLLVLGSPDPESVTHADLMALLHVARPVL